MWYEQPWEEPSDGQPARQRQVPGPVALVGSTGRAPARWLAHACMSAWLQLGYEERAEGCVHACAPTHARISNR